MHKPGRIEPEIVDVIVPARVLAERAHMNERLRPTHGPSRQEFFKEITHDCSSQKLKH